jgi:GT2 family glycosyltransferase
MIDIIIPVYTPKIPFQFYNCVRSICENTKDFTLIVVGSDKSQPKNINIGLERSTSEFKAILDWDVVVSHNWLEKLLSVLRNDEKIGIVGAKIGGEYKGLNSHIEDEKISEWPTLAGGCIVFRDLGLKWDENFKSGYWADTDFCRQYKEKGYKIFIHGGVRVKHYTIGDKDKTIPRFESENAIIYEKKWGDNEV